MDWVQPLLVFAEEEQKKAPSGAEFLMWVPLIAIFLLYLFLIRGPQRREQAAREAMLTALKKNDKVITIGGMMGTVANISPDGQEVTLKVDDNTRIKMLRSSIQRVVAAETEPDKTPETK